MSEHTKGRLAVKGEWIIPEAHADRMIGSSTNKADDKSNYAHTVAIVRGKYQDDKANARRLAAAWNACEGMTTEAIEALAGIGSLGDLKTSELDSANARIAKLEALVAERDAMLGKRPCQNSRCNELNAARALLREILDHGEVYYEAADKVRAYLDACDKPGEPA